MLAIFRVQFGTIIGVNIRTDRQTRRPKGFAFVTFETEESATNAITALEGTILEGRTLTVNRAVVRGNDTRQGTASSRDDSWKTVPSPAPSHASHQQNRTSNATNRTGMASVPLRGKKSSSAVGTRLSKATWDNWAGPVAIKKNGDPP